MATSFFYIYVMATSFFYIYVMATSSFYNYVMATSFFFIYVMASSFFYIYVMATSFFYIYKLTERPVVLLNAIFKNVNNQEYKRPSGELSACGNFVLVRLRSDDWAAPAKYSFPCLNTNRNN